MDREKMNAACEFAFSTFDDVPKLDTESPKLKFIRLNYGTTLAPRLACIIPDSATPPPHSPSPEVIDQGVSTSPVIQPKMLSKSLSPILYLSKGKYHAESPDSPTTSHFILPSLTSLHVFDNLKHDEVKDEEDSLQLPTPNK